MADYAFGHQGKAFTPTGTPVALSQENIDALNRETERAEIARLQTGPDRVFLYVRMPPNASHTGYYGNSLSSCCRVALSMHAIACPVCRLTASQMHLNHSADAQIQTWLGTPIATHVRIGPRRAMGFGYHSYRRPVSCRLYGVLYHGWYMESSGDYCRLTKAKRQPK